MDSKHDSKQNNPSPDKVDVLWKPRADKIVDSATLIKNVQNRINNAEKKRVCANQHGCLVCGSCQLYKNEHDVAT
jgi:hypothetical protein